MEIKYKQSLVELIVDWAKNRKSITKFIPGPLLDTSNRQLSDAPARVENFLRLVFSSFDGGGAPAPPVVAMIVNAREAVAIAEHLNDVSVKERPTWLVGSLGLDLRRSSSWRKAFHGGVFVEPHMPELKEFRYASRPNNKIYRELHHLATQYFLLFAGDLTHCS